MQIPTEVAANPFAVLSFMVAPAILTNASSVLAMSTSNRLARAVDRARELSKQLEESNEAESAENRRRLRELTAVENRSLMLIRSLRSFYTALGAFAGSALLAVVGAAVVSLGVQSVIPIFELLAAATGLFAVGALVHGSILLVRETRIAVQILRERAAEVRARLAR
jgi:hypothetical protein